MLRTSRRGLGLIGATLTGAALAARASQAAVPDPASTLQGLQAQLAKAPYRRDYKTAPMILQSRDQWDAEALDAVLHYAGGPKQSWDNTDLHGPWLNVMRNAMNSQVWSFKHPEFLCVSATHGPAQLALYDDSMWEKYGFAKLAGGKTERNIWFKAPPAADRDKADFENPQGAFSGKANSVVALQHRGAAFLACHNAIWELSAKMIATGNNPDHLGIEAMCAELSNHLNAGVVLTPGAVGTLVELTSNGFSYAR